MRSVFAVSERKGLILGLILFINLIVISNSVIVNERVSMLRYVMGWLISPVQLFFQKTTDAIGYRFEKYVFQKGIFDSYQTLRRQHDKLTIEHQRLVNKMRELEFWKGQSQPLHAFFLPVETIGIDPHFPYDEIRINAGVSSGIAAGMIVLNCDGDLVGQIVEPLDPFAATVRLITSQRGGVGAYIADNRLEGFVSGDRGKAGVCLFKYILESLPVEKGNLVVTSGTDQIFSAYLPLGEVVSVERDYLVQKILVKPFFTGKPIKHLFVVSRE